MTAATRERYKQMVKLLRANTGARGMYDVFTDFVEMFAVAHRNVVELNDRQKREEQYLRVAGRYNKEQLARFAEAFALVVMEMEEHPADILGKLYMELEISDANLGQFYTPYDIARLMADMTVPGLLEALAEREFVTVHEPACGAGAFLVAITQALHAAGINFQNRLHVAAEDLSIVAVHMVYLHLTLLHVPAVVHRRDSLSMETFDTWYTPAHVIGGWSRRLRDRRAVDNVMGLLTATVEKPTAVAASPWEDVFATLGGAA